jgi:hypothetical protein
VSVGKRRLLLKSTPKQQVTKRPNDYFTTGAENACNFHGALYQEYPPIDSPSAPKRIESLLLSL